MTADGVLVKPIAENNRNVGTASAVGGIAIAPSTTAKTTRRPRNRYLASPYPPAVASSVAPPAPTTTYRTVFPSQRRKIPSRQVKVSAMLENTEKEWPNSRPGAVNRS